ncbi:MAG TPA: SpoIIE family protein phosphatase [Gemmatimonas sp.]|nr:SpoIIE family protein phosphatase [Gemmatimonas sp.]
MIPGSDPAVTPARVLVVDDLEVNRDLLARRLSRMGHTVVCVNDGQQAVDSVRRESWDLVLLDVMMPVLDGIGALTAIKADPATRHVPVIMISANTEIESVVKCIELGADDYLPKPFDPVLLRARVSSSLEKKRFRDREQAYARRMQRDLEVGARIQRDFLPEDLPTVTGYEFAARFEPAREVGGDFYDALVLADGSVVLVLGDVCDKGVGAALFMALFRTLIRAGSLAETEVSSAETPGARVLRVVSRTNDYIAQTHGRTNMFATLFVGLLDPVSGAVAYVNGGHEPPRVLRADGTIRALLAPTGPAVGMLPGIPFTEGAVTLDAGETLFVLTDGVTESRNPAGALLGDLAVDTLVQSEPRSADALVTVVLGAVMAHAAGEPPADDVTMLAVRRA